LIIGLLDSLKPYRLLSGC